MTISAMKQALEAFERGRSQMLGGTTLLQILKFVLLMLLILGALVQQYQYQEMTALRKAIEQTDCWTAIEAKLKEKNG
jgi:hypothetical protein